jgi:hypothetical protein
MPAIVVAAAMVTRQGSAQHPAYNASQQHGARVYRHRLLYAYGVWYGMFDEPERQRALY